MSGATPDNEMMTRYLLGALPEAEAERCDELSIGDDEFAERLKGTEKDLVDAYVRGELTGTRLAQFKSYYLASPLRREQVRFAQALQDWGDQNAALTPALFENQGAKVAQANWLSRLRSFGSPRLAWGLAIVMLVLFIGTGWLELQNLRLRKQILGTQARRDELLRHEQELQRQIAEQHSTAAQTEQQLAQVSEERARLEQELKNSGRPPNDGKVVALMLAAPLRGSRQVPAVAIRPGDSRVRARLQLEAADYPAYQVTLADPVSNQTVWRSGQLRARIRPDSQTLSVMFPAALLRAQTYTLRVSGVSLHGASEVISDYPFRVVK